MPTRAADAGTTRWGAIWVLFLSACTLALHQGKMPSAIGLLQGEFALSLTAVGWLVSTYAVLIALLALALGCAVARAGYARFAVGGVLLAGIASIVGALSPSIGLLAAARAVEGAGWIAVAVSMPSVIGRLASDRDRPLALGLFGAFVPLGTGLMLLAAPELQLAGGWRLSWVTAGAVSLVAGLCALAVCYRYRSHLASLDSGRSVPLGPELGRPVVWWLALSFFCYSVQFLAVTSFLPTVLQELAGLSLASASRLSALVILGNVLGNLAAGRLLQRGWRLSSVLRIAAILASCGAALTFIESVPLVIRIGGALLFTITSGAMPGALLASAGRVATAPVATGIVIGLMFQGAGIGQMAGPIVLAASVDFTGSWNAGALFSMLAGAFAVLAARGLRGV